MKKIPTIAAALLTAAAFIPAPPAFAESELSVTLAGDVNLSKNFSISDLVLMEKYLLGAEKLSEQAYINADLNGDGSADVYDMPLFREKLISQYGGFTALITNLSDEAVHPDFITGYITSVDELQSFFSPLCVITVDGESLSAPVISEKDLEALLEKYDEDFFKKNALMLKVDAASSGGEKKIGRVYCSGDALIAEHYDEFTGDKTYSYEPQYQLLQVIIPRGLDNAKDHSWRYQHPDTETKAISEFTREVTGDGWRSAVGGSRDKYFYSKKEFDKWIDGKFHSAVEKTLRERYDEKFFASNCLYIDLCAQTTDTYTITPRAELTSDKLTLTYDRHPIDGFTKEGVNITQVTFKKGACQNTKAEVKRSWAEKKTYQYKEYDLGMLCESNNKDMVKQYRMKPEFVKSQAELDEYLGECLTDDAIKLLDLNLYGHSAYIWLDDDIIGAEHYLASAYKYNEDKTIELNMVTKQPLGDIGGSFLHLIYSNSDDFDSEVIMKEYNINDNYPTFDGAPMEYDFADKSGRTLFVNQFSYDDNYAADLYLTHIGGGPIRYRNYEYIGTIDLTPDYKPFNEETDSCELEDGSYSISGKEFTINFKDGVLKISCKSAPDKAIEEHEFNIGK